MRKQSAALQASTTFATAAVAAAVAVQCTTRGACYARRRRTIYHAVRRIAARAVPRCVALHQAAPGVAVALRRGEARCPDAIASQITHSIDRREGHHGATVIDSNELSVAAHSIYLLKSLLALTGQYVAPHTARRTLSSSGSSSSSSSSSSSTTGSNSTSMHPVRFPSEPSHPACSACSARTNRRSIDCASAQALPCIQL